MTDRFELETVAERVGVDVDATSADRLLFFVELLRKWQPAQNLVARGTLEYVWTRHIADSLQLVTLLDNAGPLLPTVTEPGEEVLVETDHEPPNDQDALRQRPTCASVVPAPLRIVDLGSGAGFPGLVLALMRPSRFEVTLVEANSRKAAFLRAVSRETAVPVQVLQTRIESIAGHERPPADIVTSRALAPLSQLMRFSDPWIAAGARAFFHKGGEYARELAEWPDATSYSVIEHRSGVDSNGRILEIRRAVS